MAVDRPMVAFLSDLLLAIDRASTRFRRLLALEVPPGRRMGADKGYDQKEFIIGSQ
jgi:hypothetical protein